MIPKGLSKTFEIDILIENPENNGLVEAKYNENLKAFPNKLSLHIYAPRRFGNESDRYLINNCAALIIPHPFDWDTNITCNFYPSNISKQAIRSAYGIWLKKLKLARDLINRTPDYYDSIKSTWVSDELKDSIFQVE